MLPLLALIMFDTLFKQLSHTILLKWLSFLWLWKKFKLLKWKKADLKSGKYSERPWCAALRYLNFYVTNK